MKLRTLLMLVISLFISLALVSANTKDDAKKKTSDKKSECQMTNTKADGKACTGKDATAKDCCKKGEAASKDCCKKDGKMSEKCTSSDKAKCDMSKGDKSKCPGMKASTNKTGKEKK